MKWIAQIWPIWAKTRWRAPRGRRRLELLERLPLGPQHWLDLVRVGDREILIGRSPAGLTVLGPALGPEAPGEEP